MYTYVNTRDAQILKLNAFFFYYEGTVEPKNILYYLF